MTRLHADARTTPLPRPRLSARWRVGLLALFLLSVAVVVAANLVYAPFLDREYRRLDALDCWVMLTGDLVGWAGFAVVVVRHAVRGVPFAPPEVAPGRWDRFGGWLVAGMVAFLAVDAAATWLVRSRDEARRGNAVKVTATCDRVSPAGSWYVLDCRYADGTGAVHEVRFVVAEDGQKGSMLLGDHDWKRVRAGAAPFPITVGYDADHPERCWPVGLVWWEEDRLHDWMALLALWQLGSIGLFFGILEWEWQRTGRVSWWYHLEAAVPVLFSLPIYLIATAGELLVPKLTG